METLVLGDEVVAVRLQPVLSDARRVSRRVVLLEDETILWQHCSPSSTSFGKNASDYLTELHRKLEIAKTYATSHAEREQQRYVSHNNLRSRDKHFDLGEQVLILTPDSTSHLFNKWTGPARIVDVRSPYSYTVELEDGSRRM